MNTRLNRFLCGTAITLGIVTSLLALAIPTRAAPTAALPTTRPLASSLLAPTTATTFTVNTQLDAVNPGACANNTPGQCTLREAILEANATSGATIILPGLLAGQYYNVAIPPMGIDGTTGGLRVNSSMNIVGKTNFTHPYAIIDAHFIQDGVFFINAGSSLAPVRISNVTIRSGTTSYGGGIDDLGFLTLSNVTVSGSSAFGNGGGINIGASAELDASGLTVSGNTASNNGGGINNLGTFYPVDLTVSGNTATSGNGGGIYNSGSFNFDYSTISGNTAGNNGGGIYNEGYAQMFQSHNMISGNTASAIGGGVYYSGTTLILELDNSTVSGNTANSSAGGIYTRGNSKVELTASTVSSNTTSNGVGGGIYNTGALTLTNSTVSGNAANNSVGGGIENEGATKLMFVTLSGNNASAGGGIYENGSDQFHTLYLWGTIIAAGTSGQNCYTNNYPIQSEGVANLSSDGSCAPYFTGGDLNNTDPKLGPLANNGGTTQTHALLPPSPAAGYIPTGAVDGFGCAPTIYFDQRGVVRPLGQGRYGGPACSIGAYEAEGGYFLKYLPLVMR